jgi:hypothetical protein
MEILNESYITVTPPPKVKEGKARSLRGYLAPWEM